MKNWMMALAYTLLLSAGTAASAATCDLHNGGWRCGGTTLKDAQDACNVTYPGGKQSCDSGINVCTCNSTSSTATPDNSKPLKAAPDKAPATKAVR